MKKIPKPHYTEHAVYYENFIVKVNEHQSVLDQLKNNKKIIETKLLSLSEEQLTTPYTAGKWSIKDILVHLIDCERVFVYRAMRFARNDKSPLPFFDENEFAKQANANELPIKKLLNEYKTTRLGTIAFFQNQKVDVLKRAGIASNATMSVRACAWIICGHELHHWGVINERYLKGL
jgi:uncharacterized damage-inducible protein DinB